MRHDRDPDSYMPSSASEEEDGDMDHEVSDDDDDVVLLYGWEEMATSMQKT